MGTGYMVRLSLFIPMNPEDPAEVAKVASMVAALQHYGDEVDASVESFRADIINRREKNEPKGAAAVIAHACIYGAGVALISAAHPEPEVDSVSLSPESLETIEIEVSDSPSHQPEPITTEALFAGLTPNGGDISFVIPAFLRRKPDPKEG